MTNVTDRERKIKRLRRGNVPWTGRPTSGWQTMGEPLVMLMMANNDVDHDNWWMVQRKVMAPWKRLAYLFNLTASVRPWSSSKGWRILTWKHRSTRNTNPPTIVNIFIGPRSDLTLMVCAVCMSVTHRLRTLLKIEWNDRCWLGYLVKRWGLACMLRNMQHRENMQNMHNI